MPLVFEMEDDLLQDNNMNFHDNRIPFVSPKQYLHLNLLGVWHFGQDVTNPIQECEEDAHMPEALGISDLYKKNTEIHERHVVVIFNYFRQNSYPSYDREIGDFTKLIEQQANP